jgi:hypothetical protein
VTTCRLQSNGATCYARESIGFAAGCHDRGIGGDRPEALLMRWNFDCLTLKPDELSIKCGANDVWHPARRIRGSHARQFGDRENSCENRTSRDAAGGTHSHTSRGVRILTPPRIHNMNVQFLDIPPESSVQAVVGWRCG